MELIDRYLQAVKFWLPKAQRNDIIAELSEDIRSQIEAKEAELGRQVNEGELEAILKRWGHPILVAQRYLPQRQFIGPVLFPIYCFVLKIGAWGFFVPWLLVWLACVVLSPAYRAANPIHKLGEMALTLLYPAFFFGTLAFAFFEKLIVKSLLTEDWDPRKLPPLRDPNRIPRSSSIFEIIVGIGLIVWWAGTVGFHINIQFWSVGITLAPVWRYLLCGFLLVSLVSVGLAGVNLFRPFWTPLRSSVRLAIDVIGSTLFCWLLKSAMLLEITLPNTPPEKAMAATHAINLCASKIFSVAVVLGLLIVLGDIRRIYRLKKTVTKLAQCLAAFLLLTLMATQVSAQTPTETSVAPSALPVLPKNSAEITWRIEPCPDRQKVDLCQD
jgi:hypothetical protein